MTKKLTKVSDFGGDLYCGDCFKVFPLLEPGSVDMVLCDLPYGVTQVSWDSVLPFPELWEALGRVVTERGAIVLTATQPFTSAVVSSNYKWFRHEWIWEKRNHSNFLNAKVGPLKHHESVLVFGRKPVNYYPQLVPSDKPVKRRRNMARVEDYIYQFTMADSYMPDAWEKPSSIQFFSNMHASDRSLHFTQKPVAMFEYYIKTYSKPGELVLDMTAGSGTTAIAAINTGRRYVCIEKDPDIFKIMEERVRTHWLQTARWRRKQAEQASAKQGKKLERARL